MASSGRGPRRALLVRRTLLVLATRALQRLSPTRCGCTDTSHDIQVISVTEVVHILTHTKYRGASCNSSQPSSSITSFSNASESQQPCVYLGGHLRDVPPQSEIPNAVRAAAGHDGPRPNHSAALVCQYSTSPVDQATVRLGLFQRATLHQSALLCGPGPTSGPVGSPTKTATN